MSILSHPITIVFLTALLSVAAWLVKIIFDISKTQEKTTTILEYVIKQQDDFTRHMQKSDETLSEIKEDLKGLIGEHQMMLRAGNLISSHHQKKTA